MNLNKTERERNGLEQIRHKPENVNLPENNETAISEREEMNNGPEQFKQEENKDVLSSEVNKSLEHEQVMPENNKDKEKKVESGPEKEIKTIGTVGDFIYFLETAAGESKDEREKGKLIYQAIKIRLALGAAGLNIYEVGVKKMGDNILGLYHSGSKKIELSEDLLSDFSVDKSLMEAVFRYKLMHEKKGFADEAAAQLAARYGRPHLPNIAYQEKQENFSRAFARQVGTKEALDMYLKDIRKTKSELFEEFIEKGIKIKYPPQELKRFIGRNRREKIEAAVRRKLAKVKIMLDLVYRFKKAVPELYDHLKSGVDINSSVEKILIELAEENAN